MVFEILRAFAVNDFEQVIKKLDDKESADGESWTEQLLESIYNEYFSNHQNIKTDPEARNKKHTHIEKKQDEDHWWIHQTLVDSDGLNDWSLDVSLSLSKTQLLNRPSLRLLNISSIL